MSKQQPAPSLSLITPELRLPIADLIPNPHNPRRHVDTKLDGELAENIRANGIIEPLIVRPHPHQKGKWELIAGHRRHSAAKVAGLADVPVLIRNLDDLQAALWVVSDHSGRKDFTALEQALALHHLVELGIPTADAARRMGLSESTFRRRAQLLKLTSKWQKAILSDGSVSVWQHECWEEISKYPAATQDAIFDDLHNFRWDQIRAKPTVNELLRFLADHYSFHLTRAAWPLDDPTLCPQAGACTACVKRKGWDAKLWELDTAHVNKIGPKDECLDPKCWHDKVAAHVERSIATLKSEHGTVYVSDAGANLTAVERERLAGKHGRTFVESYNLVETNKKRGKPCVLLGGPQGGRTIYIEVPGGHKPPVKPDPKPAEPPPEPIAVRRARLAKQQDAYVVNEVRRYVRGFIEGHLPRSLVSAPDWRINALLATFGTIDNRADTYAAGKGPAGDALIWKQYKQRCQGQANDCRTLRAEVVRKVLLVFEARLTLPSGLTPEQLQGYKAEAREICEVCGIEYLAICDGARASFPKPAGWKHLNADGTPKAVAKVLKMKEGSRAN